LALAWPLASCPRTNALVRGLANFNACAAQLGLRPGVLRFAQEAAHRARQSQTTLGAGKILPKENRYFKGQNNTDFTTDYGQRKSEKS